MRIGMVLDNSFPPDERVEKEALSLIENGHHVFLLCIMEQEPVSEEYKGIQIKRFKMRRFVKQKLNPTHLVLPFYRLIWRKHISAFISINKIEVLHIHDLPLSDVGVEMKNKYGIKLVCDQHEYWSKWIVHKAHYNTLIGKVVKKFSNWEQFEKTYLKAADLVITIEPPLRDKYIRDVGLLPEKVITVPNTPSKLVFNSANIDSKIVQKYKNDFVVFYQGGIDQLRGIDIIIKALPALAKKIPNVKFVYAGSIARNCNPLELAHRLGISHLAEYLGWIPLNQIPSYIDASKICVFIPRLIHGDEINNTIATKIYQYAVMHKPMIVSDAQLQKKFVKKNKLGSVVLNADVEDFTQKVLEMHQNYSVVASEVQTQSMRLISEGRVYWHQTVRNLIDFYKNLKMDNIL